MKKLLQSLLAVAVLAVLSVTARAVWDSTTGNMPITYPLCWGTGIASCWSSNTASTALVATFGGSAGMTVTSSVVTLPGNLTVAGTETNNGPEINNATMTMNAAATFNAPPVLTPVTTTFLSTLVPSSTGAVVVAGLLVNGLPGSNFALCVSSGIGAGAWVYPSTTTAYGAVTTPNVCK